MARLTKYMNKNDPGRATGVARDHAGLHRRLGKKLLFVYDLVGCDSTFDSLRFVIDAARPPQTSANFDKDFGIPRYLTFEKHSDRPPVDTDFWHGIYD